jgi:ketosteroid isomerase-like protein
MCKEKDHERTSKHALGTTGESKRPSRLLSIVLECAGRRCSVAIAQNGKRAVCRNWRGREQVGRFFSTVAQAQDVIEFEPEDFIAQGDKVIALGRFSSRVKSTGSVSASAWAHVWTVKEGKVTHFREYVDTAAVSRAHTVAPTD